jgi:hypothetical protein
MKLLNNKFFIIGIALAIVIGLLAVAQLMNKSTVSNPEDYSTTNPQYNAIKKNINDLSQKEWDKTVYYRIKNSISSYHDSKQVDRVMFDNLNDFLLKSYLLKLIATTEEFCEKSGDMNLWNELYTETAKFSSNTDMNKAIGLLNDYRNIRTTALAAENYGRNEKYDAAKNASFDAILKSLDSKSHLKENPVLKNEASSAAAVLGMIQGLDMRFNNIDLESCDCYSSFGRNEYYKNACLVAKQNL